METPVQLPAPIDQVTLKVIGDIASKAIIAFLLWLGTVFVTRLWPKIKFSDANAKGVVHWPSGKESWREKFSGFVASWPGMIAIPSTIFLAVGILATSEQVAGIKTELTHMLLGLSLATPLLCFSSQLYLRKRCIRSMELKWHLHQLMECMRDFLTNSIRRRNVKPTPKRNGLTSREEGQFLKALSIDLCNHVQAYFRKLTMDETVGCAIRLVVPTKSGTLNFETVGRSDGLSPGREKTTQPIPSDQGVPNFFVNEHNSRGLLYYYDISLAIKKGTFYKTKSEDSYGSDISTMVVAPLRGWNGEAVGLLGLLYITSKGRNTFDMKQFDSIGSLADSITTVYVAYLNQLESGSVIPEIS